MKRSRLFLGATTCLLAIAGVAAAKAHFEKFATGYYCTGLNSLGQPIHTGHCILSAVPICPVAGTAVTCLYPQDATKVYTVYTSAPNPNDLCTTANTPNCKTKFKVPVNEN